jgi:type IV secretory pathway VirB3-like protein
MDNDLSDPLFLGLARPPMFAGVPAGYFVVVMIAVGEGIFVFKHWLVFVVGVVAYLFGLAVTVRDPNAFHVIAARWLRCPPVLNARHWGGNAYGP